MQLTKAVKQKEDGDVSSLCPVRETLAMPLDMVHRWPPMPSDGVDGRVLARLHAGTDERIL